MFPIAPEKWYILPAESHRGQCRIVEFPLTEIAGNKLDPNGVKYARVQWFDGISMCVPMDSLREVGTVKPWEPTVSPTAVVKVEAKSGPGRTVAGGGDTVGGEGDVDVVDWFDDLVK